MSTSKSTKYRLQTKSWRYRGVEVVPDNDDCCQAARSIANQRFLVDEIPSLPLSACDAEQCHCTYKRFDDRRSEPRRASDVGVDLAGQLHSENNRNTGTAGRRKKDAV